MKFNWLIIIIFFVIVSAFSFSGTFEMNNPSVKIISEKPDIYNSGDIIVFSVKLCSSDNLQSFLIIPDIPGSNEDSELRYTFNENSKQATVNYFYVVPQNINVVKKISFKFILQDANNNIVKKRIISLKNDI